MAVEATAARAVPAVLEEPTVAEAAEEEQSMVAQQAVTAVTAALESAW